MDENAKLAVSEYFSKSIQRFDLSRNKLADLVGMSSGYITWLCNKEYDKLSEGYWQYFYEIYKDDRFRDILQDSYPAYEKQKYQTKPKQTSNISTTNHTGFIEEIERLKKLGFEIELTIKTKTP